MSAMLPFGRQAGNRTSTLRRWLPKPVPQRGVAVVGSYLPTFARVQTGAVAAAHNERSPFCSVASTSAASRLQTPTPSCADVPVPVLALAVSPLEIAKMPPCRFEGRIIVVSVPEDEQRVERFFVDSTLLGFDTESRPVSPLEPKSRTAVIQLATEDVTCVWRIAGSAALPPLLRRLIEDPSIHKVAQGASEEISSLREEWGIVPKSFIDLHHVALHLKTSPRSLKGLVALFMKRRLVKDQQLTNWEQSPLTQAQIEYAATDAWASRQVLLAIRGAHGLQRLDCERLLCSTVGTPRPLEGALPAGTTVVGVPSAIQQSASVDVEAHQVLAALCVERGFVLRFDGFESVNGGYRCVFRVEFKHMGRSASEAFRSKRAHSSIRAAQNDAAAEALFRLQRLAESSQPSAAAKDVS
eukprot:TRINITY_DN39353_c0_g1_i1.p1 TRINITY_DN39353_c0_g1~~TRINITY_DN39353_c0_g1_i1.p1  ORF type:complete len:412 (-),score=61.39 TRINITY_DN39353_c0_g1_i1:309-1544(-)